MYASLLIPWSTCTPSSAEAAYRSAGLVRTHGTLFMLPPDDRILIEAFNAPPRPKTRMSSGAVALCKHFERGQASSEHGLAHPFWPLPRGSNERKSEMAAAVLEDMLGNAQWRNVMMLHRGVAVYEVRNPLGYGMRWTLELELDEKEEDEVLLDSEGEGPGMNGKEEKEKEGLVGGSVRDGEQEQDDALKKNWKVKRTLFRGFLEPIEGLDHELEVAKNQLHMDDEVLRRTGSDNNLDL